MENCCYNIPPPSPYRPFLFPPPAPVNPTYFPPYDLGGEDNNNTPTWVIVGSVVAIVMFCFFLYKCIKRSEKEACEAGAASSAAASAAKPSKPAAATAAKAVVSAVAARTEVAAPAKDVKPVLSSSVPISMSDFSSCPSCGHKGALYTFVYACPSCDYKQEMNMLYPKRK